MHLKGLQGVFSLYLIIIIIIIACLFCWLLQDQNGAPYFDTNGRRFPVSLSSPSRSRYVF